MDLELTIRLPNLNKLFRIKEATQWVREEKIETEVAHQDLVHILFNTVKPKSQSKVQQLEQVKEMTLLARKIKLS